MAAKKVPSIQDGLKSFKDVMKRAGLTEFYNVENILSALNPKGKTVITIPEITLWNSILEDPDLKSIIKPLSEIKVTDMTEQQLSLYTDLSNEAWVDLNIDTLYSGKIIKISLNVQDIDFDYEIPINRDCLPVKLKKAEYTDIKYRIFTDPYVVLGIKKYFPFSIEGCGFTMMRLFKVI